MLSKYHNRDKNQKISPAREKKTKTKVEGKIFGRDRILILNENESVKPMTATMAFEKQWIMHMRDE